MLIEPPTTLDGTAYVAECYRALNYIACSIRVALFSFTLRQEQQQEAPSYTFITANKNIKPFLVSFESEEIMVNNNRRYTGCL